MSGLIWSKFFWNDWRADPALRLCGYAARGLWIDMLCLAAANEPVGLVAVGARGLDAAAIARMTGGDAAEVETLLCELETAGVFSRDRQGRIYSRRITQDARKAATARANGLRGGNPSLCPTSTNPPSDNPAPQPRANPHEPEARTRVGTPSGVPNPGCGRRAKAAAGRTVDGERADGSPPPVPATGSTGWRGPAEIWALAAGRFGPEYAASWLAPCAWQAEPERAILARTALAAERLRRDFRRELGEMGVAVAVARRAA
ncbi:hypothetical protein ACO2Q3_12140 [Caulobacter sp. KR2-114]|uniref:hypothetical protein n=1 Tax=Caulobacter sp. KR2-114 TaxID=3400912 RepID=UPI003C11E676